MKVLHLIDSLAPGGAERSMLALAPHYRDRGIALEVAYLRPRDHLRKGFERVGVPCHPLAGPGGRLGWARRAHELIAAEGPDLVHTTLFESDLAGRVAARRAGVPVVSSLVNVVYGPAHRADPAVRPGRLAAARAIDAATARLTVRLHAVSEHVAAEMSRRLHYPRHRIDVIPRGRDPSLLGPQDPGARACARLGLGIAPDAPVLLAVARQDFQKGLDVLIDAVAALRDQQPGLRVLVAGRPGGHTRALETRVDEQGLGDVVRFLGHRDDIGTLLAAADVLVLSSRREGFPGVLVEAMATSTPIVATDLPQIREAVGLGTAALVPAASPAALAAGVGEVLDDPEAARRRAALAHRRFQESFTIERVADRMVAFYRRCAR